jgi:hypothetical protein
MKFPCLIVKSYLEYATLVDDEKRPEKGDVVPVCPSLDLPEADHAAVAPLPIPLANHLYRYFLRKSGASTSDSRSLLLQELTEARESIYLYLDGYVRNLGMDVPYNRKFSTELLRRFLAPYTPSKREIPPSTYNTWLERGLIRHTSKGQPTPDSGAALAIVRMLIKGTKVFPDSLSSEEPPWWCYVQESPSSPIRQMPITCLYQLLPSALLWTPWAGASWDPAWLLLGKCFGAIRFAGAHAEQGRTVYEVTLDDLIRWKPEVAGFSLPGPFAQDALQALARLTLIHLTYRRMIYT